MRLLTIMLLSAAAFLSAALSTADVAQARDGCGPGRFYNGYRCVRGGGYGPGPGVVYAPRPYGGAYYGGPQRCPPRYTVQDGVCKPYRGY